MSIDHPSEIDRTLRVAARALCRAGLAHAYGHFSARLDEQHFLVCAAKPMSLLQPGETGTVVPVSGSLPQGVLGEVRIHQQIYARRPDVNAVARSMPPRLMSLSCMSRTPLPRHGLGSYFAPRVPLWNDPLLIRSNEQAVDLAQTMGAAHAIVMRGNGAVVAGASIEQTLVLNWYLEDAARVELDLLAAGQECAAAILTPWQCEIRASFSGQLVERMWDYLTAGDPEQ